MVTRVWGKVDGHEVIFEKDENGIWVLQVPFDEDGEYAVEVYAEDEAGNVSFLAQYVCVILKGCIYFHRLAGRWNVQSKTSQYIFENISKSYRFSCDYMIVRCKNVQIHTRGRTTFKILRSFHRK
ncbi:glycosyl hydrolase [Clostridium sp. AM45-5]|nr:PF13754 domain-containing protein [Clostridium sp. AM45-5]RHS65871.1 glycosyl hydrolase [Clostridium sp. AM45-5]